MKLSPRLKEELESIFWVTLYFGCWLIALVLLKRMVLEEYQIAFSGLSVAVVGAVLLAKVVLVLERVPLGRWAQRQPAWVDVLFRTVLYSAGVFVVLVMEKSFEGWRAAGGLRESLIAGLHHTTAIHVWLNTICLSTALFSYNLFSVVRKHLSTRQLLEMFLTPIPVDTARAHRSDS